MKIIYTQKIIKQIAKRAKSDGDKFFRVIAFLEDVLPNLKNPTDCANAKKMHYSYAQYGNIWRWRIGDYRIVGDVRGDELIIEILEIDTRENIY